MAREEPHVRLDIQFGYNLALTMLAAVLCDRSDPVQHERERAAGGPDEGRRCRVGGGSQAAPGQAGRQPDSQPDR